MVPGVGVEPQFSNGEQAAPAAIPAKPENLNPLRSPRKLGQRGEDVACVVLAWAKLPVSVREAILTLVNSALDD